jgi:hypothetical protein
VGLNDLSDSDRPLAIVSANLRLHDAIPRWADNPEALRVLAHGRPLVRALRARYGFGAGRVDEAVAEHRQLLRDRPSRRAPGRRDRRPPLRARARRAAGPACAVASAG